MAHRLTTPSSPIPLGRERSGPMGYALKTPGIDILFILTHLLGAMYFVPLSSSLSYKSITKALQHT